MADDLSNASLGQVGLRVKDLERALAFYRDTLGLKLLFQVPDMAFFDVGGVRLMVSLPSGPEHDHPGSFLYFKVSSVRAAHTELAGRGVPFKTEPKLVAKMPGHDLWMAFFEDPDGNFLALMAEERPENS